MNAIMYLNHQIKYHRANADEYRRQAGVLSQNIGFKLDLAILHDSSADTATAELNQLLQEASK